MATKRKIGQPLPIVVYYNSDPTIAYGKTYADITEATMNLKLTALDTDSEHLEKKLSTSGVTIDTNNHTFTMEVLATDYAALLPGKTYFLNLAVLFDGYTVYTELEIDDPDIKILTDTNVA